MIELANIKSQAYQGLNKRSTDNAKWENVVNLDLHQGDEISVANAIINIRGISSDQTVEILGEDNDNGVSDSKVGIRFTAYVNDNGTNSVALPFCVSSRHMTLPLHGSAQDYPTLQSLAMPNEGISFNMLTTARDNDGAGNAPYNAGEPDTSNNNFTFTFTNNSDASNPYSPFGYDTNTYYTEKAAYGVWNSVSGHKYTIMDPEYMGPFRSDADGNFHSGEDDCKPMYLDTKIDVNGPLYESPSTLADTINQQLNNTNVYTDNEINPYVQNSWAQQVELPALTGPLLKIKEVNGYRKEKGDNQKLWGNIAVRDMKKWQGIHALMRCDLTFDYDVNFNDTTDIKKIYQPCFLMPSGHIDNQVYYPRTTKSLNYKFGLVDNSNTIQKTVNFYYTTLPQYFLFTTNMKYNEANIKRIQTYMRNTEKYDGSFKTNEDSDIENWRSHWDIGFSDQSGQDNTKWMYYCAHGNYNLPQVFLPSPAYSNYTDYAGAYPYFPFPNKVDVLSTSRSDIPNLGYTEMIVEGDVMPVTGNVPSGVSGNVVYQGFYNIQHIDDTTHHFKDNKNKDASIAFYSRYDSSWQSKVRTDGLNPISFGDDSLSKQYNVGCYPVSMQSHEEVLYDLTDTYWIGCANNVPANMQYAFPCPTLDFLYYIGPPHDDDHKQYGGYSLYIYEDFPVAGWVVQPDFYIYSKQNQNRPDGRDEVNGLQYDGVDTIDLNANPNTFVIDAGNNRRWVMALWNEDDLTHANTYFVAGFDNNAGPDYNNMNDFFPLGGPPENDGAGTWFEVWLTDMHIISTDPSSPYYFTNASPYPENDWPLNNNGKAPRAMHEEEEVCAFMLYRDSATKNGSGWDISTDFALPAMHQGQFCVSASFMDNPAVWLVNAERYGENDDLPSSQLENTNYIVVGANNPTFQYDNGLSRCVFKNLHIPKVLGVEDMPTKDGEVVQTTLGNWVVKVADTSIKYGYIWEFMRGNVSVNANDYTINSLGTNQNYLLNYSIGGISIDSMYGETQEANYTSMDDMTLLTEDNWHNCLLYKLGFAYDNLFPKFGEPTNIYDYSKINSTDPAVRYEKLKPLTTNPLIDISSATSLPVQDGTTEEPNPSDEGNPYKQVGMGLPTYSLSVGSLIPTNLDGQTSESIIASGLPIKQSTPYYTIYCSLSSGDYISNTDSYQILGVIQKRFIAGDYIYGDPSPPMRVKINQKVTKIQIEIRDNAGKVVSLDDNNTVILQLDRAI